MVIAALIISTISLGWQFASFFLRRWETRIEKLEQRVHEEERRQSEAENRNRQTLKGLVDYLADVRTLNRPPAPSGEEIWGHAARRLSRTRERIFETTASIPSGHPATKFLDELRGAFHDWVDVWDEFGDLAITDNGRETLMAALDALQKARWSAEDGLRRDFPLESPL